MKHAVITALLATLALGTTSCGGDRSSARPVTGTRAATTTTSAKPSPAAPVAVRVARTDYGRALVDRRGFALYVFTRDRAGASSCYGACAAAWPPYVVKQRPTSAGNGAHAGLLGTTRRSDGRLQITYAGHPLYYYVGDRRPRQVLCQAATEFGGTWYVVASSGRAIH